MTLSSNKSVRESMIFPFRWFDSLGQLDINDRWEMLCAIRHYAESQTHPTFTERAKSALWEEYRQRIDADLSKYRETCEHRSQSGMKGANSRWKNHSKNGKNGKCHSVMAKMAEADADADYNNL